MKEHPTIVVPYDFSVHARAALSAASDLGQHLGADLHLLHVIPSPAYAYRVYSASVVPPPIDLTEVCRGVEESLRDVADRSHYAAGKIQLHVVEADGIAEAIGDLAEKFGADLIAMGTHGRTGLAHAFLGSVAERTLRSAPCHVLSVKASEEDERAEKSNLGAAQ